MKKISTVGYPDVAGTYAVVFAPYTETCSNGKTYPAPADSGNYTITQNGNAVTVLDNSTPPAGITRLTIVNPTGNTDKNGGAIMNGSETYKDATVPGTTFSISDSFTGSFTPTGFAFTRTSTITASGSSTTCSGSDSTTATKM